MSSDRTLVFGAPFRVPFGTSEIVSSKGDRVGYFERPPMARFACAALNACWNVPVDALEALPGDPSMFIRALMGEGS